MKSKLALVACIAAMLFFFSSKAKNGNDINLESLVKINTASAECCVGPIPWGRCTLFAGCVGNPGGELNCIPCP